MIDRCQVLAIEFATPEFSLAFVEQARRMGLSTVGDVAARSVQDLTLLPGFSYHWLTELTVFLEQRDALDLLQPLRGKNRG